jgi:ribonuclease P protein component
MLKKKYRIFKKGDFEKVYANGKKVKGEFGMIIGFEDGPLHNCEFGIVVGKKIGKAHERNLFKRRIRFLIQRLLNEGFFENKRLQITYVAFKKPENFKDIEVEILEQFKKLFEK